jgi:hypothetical protein
MIVDKIVDVLMFREGADDDINNQPKITTGSVVWGVLSRSFILVIASFFVMEFLQFRQYWYIILFLIWAIAVYPGWRQYKHFQEKIEVIKDETLCGSCRNFEQTNQLCKIYDEHITKTYIPCEGNNWEPNPYELDSNQD